MAIFASTTTSGYSDPLKAMSIKALEQRYKEMSAQQAAAQQGMFTPENTQTPVQGLAQVANVAVDSLQRRRADEAAAAGRNELAGMVAQGPQGPDGVYSPQQLSVMARRDPDFMAKMMQQQHDLKYQGKQLTSEEARATQRANTDLETNRQTTETSRANVAAQQAGESGRLVTSLTSKEKEGALDRAATGELQESKQEHDGRMARLNAELTAAQKEKDYAQQSKQSDAAAAADEKITRLKSELASGEARQTERFQSSQLDKTIAKDEKLAGLQREAMRANIQLEIAARSGETDKKLAAEKDLARINADINTQRDLVKQAHEERLAADERRSKAALQTQAEKATSGDVATRTGSAEKIAAQEAAAKAEALAKDPKRAEAVRSAETDYRKGLSHLDNLEEATRILEHPKGIYTGAAQSAAPIAGGIPGIGGMLVDKEKAQNTARFNTIVGEDAIRDMATTLKGSSTNYEMGEFKKMKNDPNISDKQRADQLKKVVKAARADLEAQAKEVQAIGGDTGRVDRSMKGGAATTADPLEGKTASGPDGPIIRRNGKWEKL